MLSDDALKGLKIGEVVDHGFVFLWGINSKWELCFDLMTCWGFEYVTVVHWIKKSRSFVGTGTYSCLLGWGYQGLGLPHHVRVWNLFRRVL